MNINFHPLIMSQNAEDIVSLLEELGFEKQNNGHDDVRLKDHNGFFLDVVQTENAPQDKTGICISTDRFEEAYSLLLGKGFQNTNTADAGQSVCLVSPSGLAVLLCRNQKEVPEEAGDGLIPSFSVDHNEIVPGIFVSREDEVGSSMITTYDIRVTKPNKEPAVDVAAMHSLEHIIATFLRNDPDWKNEVIYWGPMGCLTGFYLILKGSRSPQQIYQLVLDAFRSVADAESVPGTAPENCGHYLMHDLEMAKFYAAKFADYLAANAENPRIFEYPKKERLITEDGQHFYDS